MQSIYIEEQLIPAFDRRQAHVLAQVINEVQDEQVKVHDFNELKAIVKNLADAQERTEKQSQTEESLQKLIQSQQKLAERLLSKNKINKFIRRKVKPLSKSLTSPFLVLVTYMISEPDAEEYARQQGIELYYSYDFD